MKFKTLITAVAICATAMVPVMEAQAKKSGSFGGSSRSVPTLLRPHLRAKQALRTKPRWVLAAVVIRTVRSWPKLVQLLHLLRHLPSLRLLVLRWLRRL